MDIEKEREAFSRWVLTHPDNLDITSYEENIMFDAWQAAKYESHKQVALYQSEINHLAQANQQWREKAAKAQAIPDGFIVVPTEPTERMLDSAYSSISDNLHYADLENIYRAMILSAQEQSNV